MTTRSERAALAMLADAFADDATDPGWRDRALCARMDPELFFPNQRGPSKEAKQICQRCPVQMQCRKDALHRNERHGVWGGTSDRQRQKMRRLASGQTADQDTTEEAA